MNKNKTLPAGVRKHIRIEKARIRREFSEAEERAEAIKKLYNKFSYYAESSIKEKAPDVAKTKAADNPKLKAKKKTKKPAK